MKKKVFYVVSAMAAVLLASCSQDEYNRTSPKDNIVATIHPAATTRTAVDQPVESAQAVGIAWTDGDQIGVFDHEAVTQRCYRKVGAEREALASFTAAGEAFAEPTYAYYPYDAANDNKEITSLTGNLPAVQNMDSGILHGDYKYGRAKGSGASGHEFAFTHMFSLARVTVDASGTPLAGEKLREVSVRVTRNDAPVAVAGQFEFNARNGVWMQTDAGSGTVSLQWTDGPQLNSSLTAYMSMFPTVKSGDTFTITVSTQHYRASFSAQSRADFQRENIYGLPLLLKNYSSLVVYDNVGNLVYPTETLRLVSIQQGAGLTLGEEGSFEATEGGTMVTFYGNTAAANGMEVAVATFEAKAEGNATVTLDNMVAGAEGQAHDIEDVRIASEATITVAYAGDFTIAADEYVAGYKVATFVGEVPAGKVPVLAGTQMMKLGDNFVALVASSTETTRADLDLVEATAVTVARNGDVNGNEKINIVDAQVAYDLANAAYSGFEVLGMQQQLSADVNNDGAVDALDARAIQHFVMTGSFN